LAGYDKGKEHEEDETRERIPRDIKAFQLICIFKNTVYFRIKET